MGSWAWLVFRVMVPRIVLVLTVSFLLLVFFKEISRRYRKSKRVFFVLYAIYITLVLVGIFPYIPISIIRAWVISPPPGTIEKAYRYTVTNITNPSETELVFKSRINSEEIIDYYIDLFRKNGLCLGRQSFNLKERCYSKEEIRIEKSGFIVTTDTNESNRNPGVIWGFIHYIGKGDENYSIIRMSLYNYSD